LFPTGARGVAAGDGKSLQDGAATFVAYALDDVIVAGSVDGGHVRTAAAVQPDGLTDEIDGLIVSSRCDLNLVAGVGCVDCGLDALARIDIMNVRHGGGAHQCQHKHKESKDLYISHFLVLLK